MHNAFDAKAMFSAPSTVGVKRVAITYPPMQRLKTQSTVQNILNDNG